MSDDMGVRPFDSGAQYGAWRARNCENCAKIECDIDEALGLAYVGNGQVSAEIAGRMGYTQVSASVPGPWTWDCPEQVDRPARVES